MTLEEIRPSPLVDQAIQRLRDEIVGGRWPVGAKLPGETTLAKSLNVGRSTVREAIRALAGAGMVQARQGVGVFVTAAAPQEDWTTKLRRSNITDIYEVRTVIEVEGARRAAQRRSKEDLAALTKAMGQRRNAAAASNEEFVDSDIFLHSKIIAAAHNPVLAALFEQFVPTLRRGLIDLLDLTGLRDTESNHGEDAHAAVVDAIKHCDADRAGTLLHEELQQTLQQLRSYSHGGSQ